MNVDQRRRRRRRLRRQAAVLVFLLVAFALAWFFESQATTTVLLIRTADRTEMNGENPGLSPAGQARAQELARVLSDADVIAGVDVIFATQYRDTQETADPLARELGLAVEITDVQDVSGLADRILTDFKGKVALVVTSADVLPALVREFHGSKKLPPIADGEYDNLYIVSIPWYGKVKTLRLKFGAPYPPSAPGAATVPEPAAP